jgi:single-stranded-DNA-specific exonuclease
MDFIDSDNLGPLRFLGRLQLNTFRGETRLQVVIAEPL